MDSSPCCSAIKMCVGGADRGRVVNTYFPENILVWVETGMVSSGCWAVSGVVFCVSLIR